MRGLVVSHRPNGIVCGGVEFEQFPSDFEMPVYICGLLKLNYPGNVNGFQNITPSSGHILPHAEDWGNYERNGGEDCDIRRTESDGQAHYHTENRGAVLDVRPFHFEACGLTAEQNVRSFGENGGDLCKRDKRCGIVLTGGDFMENQEMDVFARAWLFLAKAVYESYGIDADFRVVPANKDGGQERG